VTAKRLGRRPGPSRAREDILAAARELFGEVGYQRATVRAIARRAKVDPSLVIQQFGSKDDLLGEALTMPVDIADVMAGVEDGPDDIGVELIRRVLTVWSNPVLRGPLLSLMRTGLSHDRAAVVMRGLIGRSVLPVLARLAIDDRPDVRAALVGSQIAGFALAREVLRIPALAEMSVDEVARAAGPAVTHYLTGDLDGGG
jgi:AcrR family transcriptional regulator